MSLFGADNVGSDLATCSQRRRAHHLLHDPRANRRCARAHAGRDMIVMDEFHFYGDRQRLGAAPGAEVPAGVVMSATLAHDAFLSARKERPGATCPHRRCERLVPSCSEYVVDRLARHGRVVRLRVARGHRVVSSRDAGVMPEGSSTASRCARLLGDDAGRQAWLTESSASRSSRRLVHRGRRRANTSIEGPGLEVGR